MASKKEKREKAAPNEGGNENNANPRHDAKEAAPVDEVATSKAKAKPKKKRGPKMQLVRVTVERFVPHRGEFLIALPLEHVDDIQEVLARIEDENGFEEFVEEYDEFDACDIPISVVAVEEIEGDPTTAQFTAKVTLSENDDLEIAVEPPPHVSRLCARSQGT